MAKVKEPIDNLRIWDALGKTDPSHTKQFKRSGGFSGTAIKPMWANKRMTEFFGPCGVGWGQTEPVFQLVPAEDEIMVYCTVGVWYLANGERTLPVYGVGGDKVLIRGKEGTRSSDEAFKAAYTDAIGNATKFIGVGADIHMGLFEDNKYVQAMKEEFKEQVEDEVAIQKVAPSEPAEIEFLYSNKILICRPIDVQLRKKDEKEFYAVKLNGKVGDKAQLIFCWHKSMFDILSTAKGKLCKFALDGAGDFFNIAEVLEVDGVRWEAPKAPEAQQGWELKARTAGSIIGFSDKQLLNLHKSLEFNWERVYNDLNAEIDRRETR